MELIINEYQHNTLSSIVIKDLYSELIFSYTRDLCDDDVCHQIDVNAAQLLKIYLQLCTIQRNNYKKNSVNIKEKYIFRTCLLHFWCKVVLQ